MATSERRATVLQEHEVVFLLGAGASVAAGVPTTVRFVEEFAAHGIRKIELGPAYRELEAELRAWAESQHVQLDIELLYETVARLAEPERDCFVARTVEAHSHFAPATARELRMLIEQYIQKRAFVDEGSVLEWAQSEDASPSEEPPRPTSSRASNVAHAVEGLVQVVSRPTA